MPRRVPSRTTDTPSRVLPPKPTAAPTPEPALPKPRAAVLYARVSSKDQEKEGFSIPAQQAFLKDYANRAGLRIVKEFTDVETAKRAGRTQFTAMVAFMRRHKSCKVILVEKTDRLYRNLKDWVLLDEMDLEIHLAKEGVVLTDDSRSADKFMHGIRVLMAKNYIDNLSEEITKGMRQKAEEGYWPSMAPVGYLNRREAGKSFIVPDPKTAPIVKQLFEMYDAGRCNLTDLLKHARSVGLKGRRSGGNIVLSTLEGIMRNPIYAGEFIWGGKRYDGKDPVLISRELFDRVQDRLDGIGHVHHTAHEFAFTNFITCQCGYAITAQLKKEKYIYYHCVKNCGANPWLRQERLQELFADQIKLLRLPTDLATFIVQTLKDSRAEIKADIDQRIAAARERYDRAGRLMDRAYEDKLDGKIDDEFFTRKRAEWEEQRAQALDEMDRLKRADTANLDLGVELIELGKSCYHLYLQKSAAEQRQLLETVGSNSYLAGGELRLEWRKPFKFLAEINASAQNDNAPSTTAEGAFPVWWT